MLIRSLVAVILTATGLLATQAAHASPRLIITNGKIFGADDIVVNSNLYDVRFHDGICANIFGACDPASFTFSDASSASAAAQALQSFVFTDSALGLFDSYPSLTHGCEQDSNCNVITPYMINRPFLGTVTFSIFDNRGAGFGEDGISYSGIDFAHSTDNEERVWAVWSVATSKDIPEPGTLWLFSLTGVLFGLHRLSRSSASV